jgi:FKBP-type peptidyl-prolyl cis-trans isomerase
MWCANAPAQTRKPSQESSEQTQQTKTTTNSGTKKTNADTVVGKVESFDPGKSIKVSVPGTIITSKTFDLSGKDLTANVPSNIKVGDWVRVRETDESNGHKVVTVSHSSEAEAGKAEK